MQCRIASSHNRVDCLVSDDGGWAKTQIPVHQGEKGKGKNANTLQVHGHTVGKRAKVRECVRSQCKIGGERGCRVNAQM